MSGGLEVRLPFGDDPERPFRLTIGGLRRVQDKCDAGPEEIASRLAPAIEALERKFNFAQRVMSGLIGRYRIDDVREPIYQGLLGGGHDAVTVAKLMAELVDERPIRENVAVAFAIVMAALEGVPDDDVGKPKGELKGETSSGSGSPAARSASPSSTRAAAARASRRSKSTS